MPPNQNQFPAPLSTPPGQPEHDPYAFFMEPGKAPKKNLLGGSSNKKLFIIAGAVVGLLLLIVFLASLSAGGNKNAAQILTLAQTQQEVIRVAKDGSKNAQSTELKNFAATTITSVSSDQQQLLALFAKNGKKIKPKDLAGGKNPQTDQALAAALAANTYDSTFASTMNSELKTYAGQLKNLAAISGPTSAPLLKKEIDNAGKLQKDLEAQLPGTTP